MITNAIAILIVIYLVYRLSTSFIIPKIQQRRLNNFKDKFKKENPHIFKDENTDDENTDDDTPNEK
ncbi:MAG: hypothetical protein LKE30_05650 [Bacteroidales bacterium]|jgi:UPF0716 family protein affecting phage T7 exclusion|nr:hypothetical protein [Bacteroidales bacterium]